MSRVLLICCVLSFGFAGPAHAFNVTGHITGGEGGFSLYGVIAVSTTLDTFYIGIGEPIFDTYIVANMQAGSYILFAYQDLSGNLTPDLDEPRGFYGGWPPVPLVLSSDSEDVDIELVPPSSGGFSGTITYNGSETGTTFVYAFHTPTFADTIRGVGILLTNNGNGDYTAFVDSFGTYYAYAFMDLNVNFVHDEGEPYGAYGGATPDPIDVEETDFPEDIDITMEDPSFAPEYPVALPLTTQLSSIYPNPFNSEAAISFSIESPGHVELKLIDILGRDVSMIANGEYLAGEHRVLLSAGSLPAGLYFVSLRTGSKSSVQRVLLLK